ncbi:MAG: hypothetical protein GYA24_03795 [Candidatus Lokiarchaeota archaeon]|nr:hypothetical protein [Candidatus Lokiarchaeota archaeon]
MRARNVDTLELVQHLAIDPVPTDPALAQAYVADHFGYSEETPEYEAELAKVSAPGYFFGIEFVTCACNGRFLACYSGDETIYIINIGSRPWTVQRTIPIQPDSIHPVGGNTPLLVDDPFSPDGRWVADYLDNGTLVVRTFDPKRDKHPCEYINRDR